MMPDAHEQGNLTWIATAGITERKFDLDMMSPYRAMSIFWLYKTK